MYSVQTRDIAGYSALYIVLPLSIYIGASGEPVSTDKFLIQAYQLEAGASVSNHDLPSTWKTFPRKDIMEVRYAKSVLSRDSNM